MENIPVYVHATFVLTLIATIYLFYRATHKSKSFVILLSTWIAILTALGYNHFFAVTDTIPPRFPLLLMPPLVFTIIQFSTKGGRSFIDSLDLRTLTIIHIVRLPVEIVLHWLFVAKAAPQLMTFEGRNFDIISGITAPVIYYFAFVKGGVHKYVMIAWNILCMALLVNIIINAVLAAPTPFQQFGFEAPNIAVLHLPFLFLPACIVPIVLFSHLASIRQLLRK